MFENGHKTKIINLIRGVWAVFSVCEGCRVYIYRYMPRYKCLNRQVVYLKIYAVMQGPKHTGLYMYRYMPRYRHLIQTCIYVLVFAINICSVSKVVLHAKIYNYIFNSRHKYIFVFNS